MKRKKEILLEAIQKEDWKLSLSIAKSFKYDFDKDEQKTLQHAYAFLIGQSVGFFEELNIDMQSEYEKAIEILKRYSAKFDKIEPFYVNETVFKENIRKRLHKEWGFDKDKTEE